MPTAPLTGSRYPASTDVPNVPQFIQNAVYDLEDNTVPRFANAAARTTAFNAWVAAGNTLTDGLLCYMQDDHRIWRYSTTQAAWTWEGAAGQLVRADYTNASNLALANTATALTAFNVTVPTLPSGRHIRVTFSGSVQSDTAGTAYGFTLNLGAFNHRGVIHLPIAGLECNFTITGTYDTTTTGTGSNVGGSVTGGRFAGTGACSLAAVSGSSGPAQYLIEDLGAV